MIVVFSHLQRSLSLLYHPNPPRREDARLNPSGQEKKRGSFEQLHTHEGPLASTVTAMGAQMLIGVTESPC